MPMQSLVLHAKGLYTNPSDIGTTVPDGALTVADDVVIRADDLIEPRRGLDRSYGGLSNANYRARKLWVYNKYLMAVDSANLLSYYSTRIDTAAANVTGSGSWVSLGTYAPPSGVKTRFAEANQNLYLTTSNGVYKTDAYNTAPRLAGAVRALDLQSSVVNVTGNWLADTYYTAYRCLWGYTDANNNLLLGTPSQREVIQNTGASATRAVNLVITIPPTVSTSWFCQVYRAAASVAESSDEMGLVYEVAPTQGSFSTYTKTFVDANVTPATDTITITGHGFATYDMVQLTSTGTLPAGLALNTTYYVIKVDANNIKLATSYANATSSNAVDITAAAGGGTHTVAGAQQFSFNDITPDSLRGATLYTSASQQTISQSNDQPPLAKDIAVYKNVMFYANTVGLYNYTLTLLSASALAVNDTVVIGGATYTAKNAEAISSAQFQRYNTGSTSQDIRNTAVSLVRVINGYSGSTVYASYISGYGDLPGQIYLYARTLGASAFTVQTSTATPWTTYSTTAVTATNATYLNGLYYSKVSQPEAVPAANYFFVGSANSAILRILPLRDSLFILKEDGVYRLSGTDTTSFRVDLFDSTTELLAPDSAVVMNNQIWCLTTQGVVAITEAGVAVRSRPIESTLLNLQGVNLSVLRSESFGVAYDTERSYILFVPSVAGDTGPSQAFVFNTFTNAWTRWVLARSCGIVGPADDKLYLGNSADSYVSQERKAYNYQDYVDYGQSATVSAVSGTTVTMTATDTISVGDVIYQSSTVFGIVAAVNSIAGTVTMSYATAFSNGAVTIYKAIATRVAWAPVTGNNPGVMKQFSEVSLVFKRKFVGTAYLYFSSDISPAQEAETLTGSNVGGWGLAPWGSTQWGGEQGRVPVRCYVSRNHQRCTQLTIEFRHSVGYSNWMLVGPSVSGTFDNARVAV